MEVKLIDLSRDKEYLYEEVKNDIEKIIKKSAFVGGEYLERFESHFASYHGVKHCIGVGSGTDALWLSLLALGIGPGDEVIVPSNTFIATAFAVTQAGAKAVFADADANSYNINISSIEKLITEKTKAVIPVHLYGNPCDMALILSIAKKHNLRVIEDCAQAAGASIGNKKVGSFGDVGCFSFYPTKNLAGLAQGGAIITNSYKVDEMVRSLGNVGRSATSHTDFDYVGFNSRLDSINASYLDKALNMLDENNQSRIEAARIYNSELSSTPAITPLVYNSFKHVYHLYNIRLINEKVRGALQEFLKRWGIGSGVYYPMPCHKQKMYNVTSDGLKVSVDLSKKLLALPMYVGITEKEVRYVCNSIKGFFGVS